jgi:metal-responsive CopG/Arc/MetJ family transcriptional regulator
MEKEKKTKEIRVMIHPSLYKEFKKKCGNEYKTISEVIRDMIVEYTKVSPK